MTKFSVYILGSEYVVKCDTRKNLGLSENTEGECRFYTKEILISTDVPADNEKERELLMHETIMHELAHAFLYESGFVTDAFNEKWAEWLSVNVFKMIKCCGVVCSKIWGSKDV